MKRFTFALEPVLSLRKQEEQTIQQELAQSLSERFWLERNLQIAREEEQKLFAYFRENRLTAVQMQQVAAYDEISRQRIVDAQVILWKKDEEIKQVREKLSIAAAKRKALEKLRTKRHRTHMQLMEKEAIKELDEQSILRFGRVAA